jgi:hypothetical protein
MTWQTEKSTARKGKKIEKKGEISPLKAGETLKGRFSSEGFMPKTDMTENPQEYLMLVISRQFRLRTINASPENTDTLHPDTPIPRLFKNDTGEMKIILQNTIEGMAKDFGIEEEYQVGLMMHGYDYIHKISKQRKEYFKKTIPLDLENLTIRKLAECFELVKTSIRKKDPKEKKEVKVVKSKSTAISEIKNPLFGVAMQCASNNKTLAEFMGDPPPEQYFSQDFCGK